MFKAKVCVLRWGGIHVGCPEQLLSWENAVFPGLGCSVLGASTARLPWCCRGADPHLSNGNTNIPLAVGDK